MPGNWELISLSLVKYTEAFLLCNQEVNQSHLITSKWMCLKLGQVWHFGPGSFLPLRVCKHQNKLCLIFSALYCTGGFILLSSLLQMAGFAQSEKAAGKVHNKRENYIKTVSRYTRDQLSLVPLCNNRGQQMPSHWRYPNQGAVCKLFFMLGASLWNSLHLSFLSSQRAQFCSSSAPDCFCG